VRASYSRTWQPHLNMQPRELEPAATKFTLQFMLLNTRFTLYPKHTRHAHIIPKHRQDHHRTPPCLLLARAWRVIALPTLCVVSFKSSVQPQLPMELKTVKVASSLMHRCVESPDQEDG
jgi:hypothetical protein